MSKPQNDIITTLLALINKLFNALKSIFNPSSSYSATPDKTSDKPENAANKNQKNALVFVLVLLFAGLLVFSSQESRLDEIPYSKFLNHLQSQNIEKAIVTERYIIGTLKTEDPTTKSKEFSTVPLWKTDLAQLLQNSKVDFVVRSGDNWLTNLFFNWIIPLLILVMIWSWVLRRTTAGAQSFLKVGNKARIQQDTQPKMTFANVAGAESAKQELQETIDFLKSQEKVQKLGGRMPKGVLLVGAPGTGKTLLARAVSGEAKVPFFNISGSEFIELFVGVGAARVRELFEQARSKAPCIIFIDELDALGRARGGPVMMGGHDEREQTLNQLLTEMDGFDTSVGVVVMAATNRPEVLDKALLRSGRFDRQIIIDKPDLKDRVEILKLHTKGMKMADNIDLTIIAKRTPGLVGADLANIANEAAIVATRGDHTQIEMSDFEAAIDRILAGPEKKNRVLNPDEKRRVAFHESGHALVAEHVPTGQPVHKISIIPRGVAGLGFTLQLPVEEKFLSTEDELKDQITILLAGRITEEVVLGSISTGAQNDLEKASEIARSMICSLGMNKNLGAVTYGKRQQMQFLPTEMPEYRNYSDETARLIDNEVMALITDCAIRARSIITENRAMLDQLAALLQEKETINREEFAALLKLTK